jgi:hypothetical protein
MRGVVIEGLLAIKDILTHRIDDITRQKTEPGEEG